MRLVREGKERKGREWKGREGKERKGKEREGKGREFVEPSQNETADPCIIISAIHTGCYGGRGGGG